MRVHIHACVLVYLFKKKNFAEKRAGVWYKEVTPSKRHGEAGSYMSLSITFAKLSFYKSFWESASNASIRVSLQNKGNTSDLLVLTAKNQTCCYKDLSYFMNWAVPLKQMGLLTLHKIWHVHLSLKN